jgi:glycosyltransferase involved in cell wall biosynthesis
MTITHLTSVHNSNDTRIFYKECSTLAKKYNVRLIGKAKNKQTNNGVEIIPFPHFRNRLIRILYAPFLMFYYAIKYKSQIYHIHDPELMITILLLKIFTKAKIVYDIHEDNYTGIINKTYIPTKLAKIVAYLFRFMEKHVVKIVDATVLAESYYKKIYPSGIEILNYQLLDPKLAIERQHPSNEIQLLYTGSVSEERGALLHARIVDYVPNTHITFVGYCPKSVANKIYDSVYNINMITIIGVDEYIDRSAIIDAYASDKWLAGLAIFPSNYKAKEKRLTKFYEYMQAGLPIIASDFPGWKEVIEKSRCGICVNPDNEREISNTLNRLFLQKELFYELSQNGQAQSRQKYNWKNEELKLFKLYEDLLNQ